MGLHRKASAKAARDLLLGVTNPYAEIYTGGAPAAATSPIDPLNRRWQSIAS
jgi:hypothetical protein